MKKEIIISFFLGVALTCSSCQEFLAPTSPSNATDELIFSNETESLRAIMSIYSAMMDGTSYGLRLTQYYPTNTDVDFCSGGTNPAFGGEVTRFGIYDMSATPNNEELVKPWENLYIGINRANQCIRGIEKGDLFAASSPDQPSPIRQMYGEAKALRAVFYLDLVRHWGDVPFKTKPTESGDNFYEEATDRDEILTFLVQDLIEAEPAMLWAKDIFGGVERINRGAVQALIARIALTRGGYSLRPDYNDPSASGEMKRPDDYLDYYTIAREYANKLYESKVHQLSADYGQIFRNQCENKTPTGEDMLWELGFLPGLSGNVGFNTGVRLDANSNNPWGSATPWTKFTLPYFYSFDPQDVRRGVTCCCWRYAWNDVSKRMEQGIQPSTNTSIGKWSKMWVDIPLGSASEKNSGINWPMIRYADALLMLAEAENEIHNGPTPLAQTVLKEVRQRAFDPTLWPAKVDAYVNALNTKEKFFDAIVNERAWEFGGEAIRKYDLIRWNLLTNKLKNLREELSDIYRIATGTGIPSDENLAKYQGRVSAKIFALVGSDGNFSQMLGLDTPETRPNNTWLQAAWADGILDASGKLVAHFDAAFKEVVVKHDPIIYIYPIHTSIIAESKGALRNYYGK